MGNSSGNAGHLLANFEFTEDAELNNAHDKIWRNVGAVDANPNGTPAIPSDTAILMAGTIFQTFRTALTDAHDAVAHSYIGGRINDPHYSFHDPFVFLLHSNVDRLWAKWQTESGHAERITPATADAARCGRAFTASQNAWHAASNSAKLW